MRPAFKFVLVFIASLLSPFRESSKFTATRLAADDDVFHPDLQVFCTRLQIRLGLHGLAPFLSESTVSSAGLSFVVYCNARFYVCLGFHLVFSFRAFEKQFPCQSLTRPAASSQIAGKLLWGIGMNEDDGWAPHRRNPPRRSHVPLPTIQSDSAVKEMDSWAVVESGETARAIVGDGPQSFVSVSCRCKPNRTLPDRSLTDPGGRRTVDWTGLERSLLIGCYT